MKDFVTASNLKRAGAVALATYLAHSFTAGQSKLVQGGAMFAAAAVALPLAAKL